MARAKRGDGAGTISPRPRKDGRYESRLTLPDGTRRSFYGATWAEAEAKLNAARAELTRGHLPPPAKLRLGEYLDTWLAAIKPTLRHQSYLSYEQAIRLYLKPQLGREKLATLSTPRLQIVFNELVAGGLSPNTVKLYQRVLRAALTDAVAWGLAGRNAAGGVKLSTTARALPELTLPQVQALLAAARGKRLEAVITVGLALGLRSAEVRGLRWRDIDLEAGTLTVRHQLIIYGGGDMRLEELKTTTHRRPIALPAVTLAALRAHRDRQAFERQRAGALWEEHDLVFCNAHGRGLYASTMRYLMQTVCAAARLPYLRFHDLRHLCATLLIAQGVPMNMVKELLGHADVRTTLAIYAHVTPELRQQTALEMDALLRQADES